MIEALALDALLILILLLLFPIGLYRGGLREVCSAAGVLLGFIVADQWSNRWGSWMADTAGFDEGVSKFVVAVGTIVIFGGVIGYGAAASFTYAPGPGGRMYGGLISVLSGVIFIGALIQFVSTYLYDDVLPDIVRNGYVSRAFSVGFEWVLLAVALTVLLASLFGTIVRERDTDEAVIEVTRERPAVARRPPIPVVQAPEPENLEPVTIESDALGESAAVKIREVRHWEEPRPPTIQELKSGWTRTWPSSVTGETRPPDGPGNGRRISRSVPSAPRQAGSDDESVLRDWLAEDNPGREPRRPRPRSIDDD